MNCLKQFNAKINLRLFKFVAECFRTFHNFVFQFVENFLQYYRDGLSFPLMSIIFYDLREFFNAI